MTIRAISGDQFTEAKEAIATSLLTRVYREMSGDGERGAVVLGEKPSKRFATGFLMPMRDAHGIENTTENLRISVHGLDFQTHKDGTGEIKIAPFYSIYIRELPTWDDLCSRPDMVPRFMLRPDIKSGIDTQINHLLAAAEEENKRLPRSERRPRRVLREEISREVRIQMGLPDIIVATEGPEDEEGPEVDENTVLPYQVTGSGIPDALVSGTLPSQKWRRFSVSPDISVNIPANATAEDLVRKSEEVSAMLRNSLTSQYTIWAASTAGQEWAYRPLRVFPSDVTNRAGWEEYLRRARGTAPDISMLLPPCLPDINILITKHIDFGMSHVNNIRAVIENYGSAPPAAQEKHTESCIHQVGLVVTLPKDLHHRLKLERIKPTYRFRHFFNYAAMGINCGANERSEGSDVVLATNWMPTYQQPRMDAREIKGLKTNFATYADPSQDLNTLHLIPEAFRCWVTAQAGIDPTGHLTNPVHKIAEMNVFNADIVAYSSEIKQIERGIRLLQASHAEWVKDSSSTLGAPFRAWMYLNMTMSDAWGADSGWRLFQMTFILAHLPVIVSRMKEYNSCFNLGFDEETATLLYYPTGGGKSEAFYGLLIFNLFLDRLRGKNIGITALIRYPLRLLTIQQAQRLFKLLAKAEMVKLKNDIGGDEFTIGFWVGSGNTPNRNNAPEISDVKAGVGDPDPAPGSPHYQGYRIANQSYNKVPVCPHCGGTTGLRRGADGNKVVIVCRTAACQWNLAHGGFHPLPFLITDEDIYGFAPAVILGTIDKLALIGQNDSTINKIAGMLGLARYRDTYGRLLMPRSGAPLAGNPGDTPIAPAFSDGLEIFHDPFPSLLIQDEAHLLEESLGTFASLFETSFDQLLEGLAASMGDRVARRTDGRPRLPKVIAATATISSPERQMEMLYQRRAVRFPHPGTSLYESFYSVPKEAQSPQRHALLPDSDPKKPEVVSPLMRVYVSLITNGRVYAVATAITLSTYHAVVCRLWRKAANGDATLALELVDGLPNNPLTPFWSKALLALDCDTLHSLLDLFRIALVYVNSKRGGDQVIEAIAEDSHRGHLLLGEPFRQLRTELISGGVDISAIQRVMSLALEPVKGDDIDGSLREIVATSAISHGVDVDMFNAMFFIGAPNDISELIQASSRVGRTHVGFSMLLPTPHSRRDRYIVEVHDIFNRFLEQMVAPAAIERWAANAINRVMPSIFQLWLNGIKEQELFVAATDKTVTQQLNTVVAVKRLMSSMGPRFYSELTDFAKKAIAVRGRGVEGLGRPGSASYYESIIDQKIRDICIDIDSRTGTTDSLSDYWGTSYVQRKPMTSLRDIDEAGIIIPGVYLPGSGFRRPTIDGAILIATKVVRNQYTDSSDMDVEGGGI
jgi:hypothetical protein